MNIQEALSKLSPLARQYHDEYWQWLWHGSDTYRTIGDKKLELRQKYGAEVEEELVTAIRNAVGLGKLFENGLGLGHDSKSQMADQAT